MLWIVHIKEIIFILAYSHENPELILCNDDILKLLSLTSIMTDSETSRAQFAPVSILSPDREKERVEINVTIF